MHKNLAFLLGVLITAHLSEAKAMEQETPTTNTGALVSASGMALAPRSIPTLNRKDAPIKNFGFWDSTLLDLKHGDIKSKTAKIQLHTDNRLTQYSFYSSQVSQLINDKRILKRASSSREQRDALKEEIRSLDEVSDFLCIQKPGQLKAKKDKFEDSLKGVKGEMSPEWNETEILLGNYAKCWVEGAEQPEMATDYALKKFLSYKGLYQTVAPYDFSTTYAALVADKMSEVKKEFGNTLKQVRDNAIMNLSGDIISAINAKNNTSHGYISTDTQNERTANTNIIQGKYREYLGLRIEKDIKVLPPVYLSLADFFYAKAEKWQRRIEIKSDTVKTFAFTLGDTLKLKKMEPQKGVIQPEDQSKSKQEN